MNVQRKCSMRQGAPFKKQMPRHTMLELGHRHLTRHAREGTQEIGCIARSIGFSMQEALQIEAIYQSTPGRLLKGTSDKATRTRALTKDKDSNREKA